MTVKLKLKDVKDKLKDNILDLSFCELEEVPVREISSLRKATDVNLSTNLLASLPTTFVTLKQIVKLDLSKNMLVELPENFGEMAQLKYLDLYANQISRLPLSLGELKNLRWLDLKENPLTEAVAKVAGPCSNMRECQACARNIVTYLSTVKLVIEEERSRRLNNIGETEKEIGSTKKESKKKKKKNTEKESKSNENKANSQNKSFQDNNDSAKVTELLSDNMCTYKSHKSTGTGLCRPVTSVILWFFIISSLLTVALVMLSWHYEQETDMFLQNAQTLSGLPLKHYHKHTIDLLHYVMEVMIAQIKIIVDVVNNFYEDFTNNVNNIRKEL